MALSTLLGVGAQLSIGSSQSDLVRAIQQSTQQNAATSGRRITEKNLNIQPTITIRPGSPLRVIVHKDLVLQPLSQRLTLVESRQPSRSHAGEDHDYALSLELNNALRD